ncbi:ribonuclease T [Escherichia coli]|uniref:Ribonuclease T n=1 Tax=Escherichia coli TaxID=562 RepID=A0A377K6K0_ECOLX|nr:ribonuclease T [Escherichia coli]
MSDNAQLTGLCDRFRGFYPVVIDVETAGFNAKTDALLEIAAITLKMDEQGWLMPDTTLHFHVEPFVGANLQPEALPSTALTQTIPIAARSASTRRCTKFLKLYVKVLKRAVVTAPLWWHTTPISITAL